MKQTTSMMNAILRMMKRSVAVKDNSMLFADQLPADAKSFVMENFPNTSIAYAEKKGNDFEISLNDGTEVTYSREGAWEKVDCKAVAVPSSLLPQNIVKSVKELFNDALVVCVGKNKMAYSVALSNGVCLKYDKDGHLA